SRECRFDQGHEGRPVHSLQPCARKPHQYPERICAGSVPSVPPVEKRKPHTGRCQKIRQEKLNPSPPLRLLKNNQARMIFSNIQKSWRNADWLTLTRLRLWVTAFGLAWFVFLGLDFYLHTTQGITDAQGVHAGRDFINYWSGAKLAQDA